MKITITINTDNDAFRNHNYNNELDRLLKQATFEIVIGTKEHKLMDLNGNTVGKVIVTGS